MRTEREEKVKPYQEFLACWGCFGGTEGGLGFHLCCWRGVSGAFHVSRSIKVILLSSRRTHYCCVYHMEGKRARRLSHLVVIPSDSEAALSNPCVKLCC